MVTLRIVALIVNFIRTVYTIVSNILSIMMMTSKDKKQREALEAEVQ
jgi:hypothetical protein